MQFPSCKLMAQIHSESELFFISILLTFHLALLTETFLKLLSKNKIYSLCPLISLMVILCT